jgi:hypothetical protein
VSERRAGLEKVNARADPTLFSGKADMVGGARAEAMIPTLVSEVGVIVIGIVIALSGEQILEAIH